MSAHVSPSIVNQGTTALADVSVLPTTTVCLMPLAFVNTVAYMSFTGKSLDTVSLLLVQFLPSVLMQKYFWPPSRRIPIKVSSDMPVSASALSVATSVLICMFCTSLFSFTSCIPAFTHVLPLLEQNISPFGAATKSWFLKLTIDPKSTLAGMPVTSMAFQDK